jgi:hypothetical protein
MRARHLTIEAWVGGLLLTLTALPVRAADDPDKVISDLRQVTFDLTDAVKRFETHLDREISLHDRGYRAEGGRRIPGADADLIGEAVDIQAATRKLFAARMMAARKPGYAPIALADADRIQKLIVEARSRIATGNDVMRQFLMVSAKDLNSQADGDLRVRRFDLLKARDAATEAAKRALVVLPFDLPTAESPEELKESAWGLMNASLPIGQNDAGTARRLPQQPAPPQQAASEDAVVLPIRFEPGKRVTLIHGPFRRATLTDSGIEDRQGRRLFYQEVWEQRQGVTVVKRWAVAVNTGTGQHTLLRRYPLREFPDDLDIVYKLQGRDYLSRAALPDTSAPPSLPGIAAAADEAARSREELQDAVLHFRTRIGEALARNDAALAAQNKPALDDELPLGLRENLFAIRAHMARTAEILDTENQVHRAVEQASAKARILEALAAWIGGRAIERESPEGDSRTLLDALNRADTEIALVRSLEREALAALPPDSSRAEEQFPALMKDAIVRIRGVGAPAEPGGTIRCRQEIWRLAGTVRGERQVKRSIVLIDLGPKTLSQIPVAREVRYYRIEAGENLESVFDENAAQ